MSIFDDVVIRNYRSRFPDLDEALSSIESRLALTEEHLSSDERFAGMETPSGTHRRIARCTCPDHMGDHA